MTRTSCVPVDVSVLYGKKSRDHPIVSNSFPRLWPCPSPFSLFLACFLFIAVIPAFASFLFLSFLRHLYVHHYTWLFKLCASVNNGLYAGLIYLQYPSLSISCFLPISIDNLSCSPVVFWSLNIYIPSTFPFSLSLFPRHFRSVTATAWDAPVSLSALV